MRRPAVGAPAWLGSGPTTSSAVIVTVDAQTLREVASTISLMKANYAELTPATVGLYLQFDRESGVTDRYWINAVGKVAAFLDDEPRNPADTTLLLTEASALACAELIRRER